VEPTDLSIWKSPGMMKQYGRYLLTGARPDTNQFKDISGSLGK
jgi:hypothetical protein